MLMTVLYYETAASSQELEVEVTLAKARYRSESDFKHHEEGKPRPYPPAHAPNTTALSEELPCADIAAATDTPMLTPSSKNNVTPIQLFIVGDIPLRARQSFHSRNVPVRCPPAVQLPVAESLSAMSNQSSINSSRPPVSETASLPRRLG